MRNFLTIVLVLLLVCFGQSYSQKIPFENYTVKEESARKRLPASIIYDIEQDSMGYIWLATQVGAIKYDGYNFDPIAIKNGLPDNNIRDIFIDSKNKIWIATESGGLAYLENNKLHLLNTQNGLVSDNSLELLEDHAGNIWYFSYEGISIIKPDTLINFNEQNSGITGKIFATWIGFDGKVWFSLEDHLYYYDGEIHEMKAPQIKEQTIRDIQEDKPGSIWFSSQQKGVIHISNKDTTIFNVQNGLNSNTGLTIQVQGPDTVIVSTLMPGGLYRIVKDAIDVKWEQNLKDVTINQILVDRRDRVWISTFDNGIFQIEHEKMHHLGTENNLVDNSILKILEDKNGNIWIASPSGLSKYGKVIFQVYNEGFIDNDITIFSIAEEDGNLYMGTSSGLNILNDNGIIAKFSRENNSTPESFIFSILPLEDKIWLGTYYGITKFENSGFQFIPYSQDNDWTQDIIKYDESLYCATSRGLLKYDNVHFTYYTVENGLSDNDIWSLSIDESKNIWCATVNGLSIFDGNQFHNYGINDGLPDNYCNDITFDLEGNAWLGTDNGLSKIKLLPDWTIECSNLSSTDGLGSDIIYSVLLDKQGYIWAGHNLGLDRIDPKTLQINHYGFREGFTSIDNMLGASTITSGNDLWFGTAFGAVKYLPENDFIFEDPPKIYVKKINLYEDSVLIDKYGLKGSKQGADSPDLILPYNKNNLVFHYVGLHYTIVEKNQYKYFLEGYDINWTETHEIVTIPYRKIPPGKYTFKVLAANCDGIWTEEPAQYSFEIRPPFWKTWWFYTLEAISGIALLILFIRLRERKLRQDKIILTQKVKERTLEIAKQRDQIVEQKKEITDSIQYAERIQTAVLPKGEYIDSLLPDYFILFKPRDIVSGDFYWINGKDGKVVVVAADCTGHGVPGAFMSMLGVSILNELASEPKQLSADSMLNLLREHLTKTLRQTGTEDEAKDGMDLALILIDYPKMTVQFAGAYNPLLHIREGECTVYKGDKMPVGYHLGEMNPFTSQLINLSKGDCLYLFSDGYADQFGGPDDKKFKSAKLRELLTEIHNLPMKEQKVRLNETIENWKGINEQIDDILVVGIRI